MNDVGMMINFAKKFGGGSGTGSGGGSSSGSIPTTTEPNMHLVTDADGKMVWESKGGGEVVVLEETTVPVDSGGFRLTTPFTESLVAGNMYKVTYNGTEYECTGVEVTMDVTVVGLGNLSLVGVAGGNDSAPFALVEYPPEHAVEAGFYVICEDFSGASSVTISIIDTGKTEAAGGGVEVLTVTATAETVNGLEITYVSHTLEKILEAVRAGHIVRMLFATSETIPTLATGGMILPLTAYQDDVAIFCAKVMYNTTYQVDVNAEGAICTVGT